MHLLPMSVDGVMDRILLLSIRKVKRVVDTLTFFPQSVWTESWMHISVPTKITWLWWMHSLPKLFLQSSCVFPFFVFVYLLSRSSILFWLTSNTMPLRFRIITSIHDSSLSGIVFDKKGRLIESCMCSVLVHQHAPASLVWEQGGYWMYVCESTFVEFRLQTVHHAGLASRYVSLQLGRDKSSCMIESCTERHQQHMDAHEWFRMMLIFTARIWWPLLFRIHQSWIERGMGGWTGETWNQCEHFYAYILSWMRIGPNMLQVRCPDDLILLPDLVFAQSWSLQRRESSVLFNFMTCLLGCILRINLRDSCVCRPDNTSRDCTKLAKNTFEGKGVCIPANSILITAPTAPVIK